MFKTCVPAALAAISVSALSHADLSADYRALLDAAAAQQDDAGLLATATLVAGLSETGQADVLAHIEAHAAHRLAVFAAWQGGEATEIEIAAAEVDVAVDADIEAAEDDEADNAADRGWAARALNPQLPEFWSGRASFGLRIDQGNVDLKDFAFALELDREIEEGWDVDSRFAYAFSEADDQVTRDNWLLEARLSRTFEEGAGYYIASTFEDDEVGSYARSAFVTGGAIWQVVDNPKFDWSLRAGAGARYREERLTGEAGWNEIVEAGSHFHWQITETARLESETTAFAGGGSRITQNLTVRTPVAEQWALETALRARHEFDTEPGVEPTETTMNVSLSRDF